MKKYIVWLLALVLVLGTTGCKKEKPFTKKVIVGFLAENIVKTRDGGMDMEIDSALIQKKIYQGIIRKLPRQAIAFYYKDGKAYRHDEPLAWTVDRDDIVTATPMPYAECRSVPIGTKFGKTVFTVTAQNGTVDSTEVYVIPELMDPSASVSSWHKHAIVLDEEAWLSEPDRPGFGAKRWPTEEHDILFEQDGIHFPYGAVQLDLDHAGFETRFDLVDWNIEVGAESAIFPYQPKHWYLCHDKSGRKIALFTLCTAEKPLNYLAWHAYENE